MSETTKADPPEDRAEAAPHVLGPRTPWADPAIGEWEIDPASERARAIRGLPRLKSDGTVIYPSEDDH